MPSMIKARPTPRIGQGVVVGTLAVITNDDTANNTPRATSNQPRARIASRASHEYALTVNPDNREGDTDGLANGPTYRVLDGTLKESAIIWLKYRDALWDCVGSQQDGTEARHLLKPREGAAV